MSTQLVPTDGCTDRLIEAPRLLGSADDRLTVLLGEARKRAHALAADIEAMLGATRTMDPASRHARLAEFLHRQAHELRSMHELMERWVSVRLCESATGCISSQVDLRKLVLEVLRSDGKCLRAAGCSCSVIVPYAVHGYWDDLQLRAAIRNLLGNAVKRGHGRPIEISVGTAGGEAFVRVVDRGGGLDAETRERIFERSEAAGDSDRDLWLARSIAHAHGGDLALDCSHLGTTCTLHLPNGRG